jgi:hypothetical protein
MALNSTDETIGLVRYDWMPSERQRATSPYSSADDSIMMVALS